jgi:hypothetical protein
MDPFTSRTLGPKALRAFLILAVLPLGVANAHPQQPPTTYDDTDPSIVYSQGHNGDGQNGWLTASDPNDFAGGCHYSNGYSASFVVHFSGTDFSWIGRMGPNYGIASVFMDGQFQGTVDSYNPSVQYQQVLWSTSGMPDGVHVFQMKIGDYPSPATNPASSGCYQVLDGYTTSGTPLNLSMLSPQDGSVTKIGTWTFGPNILSGAYCWSNDRATPASLTFPFSGTGVEVYGHPEGEDGMMDVYIDGTYVTTVDEFNPLYDSIMSDSNDDSLLYVATGLPDGSHSLQLVVSQNHNPNSLDYFTQIDGFIALPSTVTPPPPPPPGSLTGSSAGADPACFDLTALGTFDWAHWGRGGSYGNFDDKASGGGQISDVTVVGSGNISIGGAADPSRMVTWSDGTPTPSGADNGYIWSNGDLGTGFSFTVPADTTPRTLLVFWGASNATATINAHLSDGSAPDYTDSQTGPYTWLETLTYQAGSAGQSMTITLTKTGNNAGFTDGSADLVAVMLQDPPAPTPPPATPPAASSSTGSSGGCGLTGLETAILLALGAVLRRRRS